jgi:hypothetical protein
VATNLDPGVSPESVITVVDGALAAGALLAPAPALR